MKQKIEITFDWWVNENKLDIPVEHMKELEDFAIEKIKKDWTKDYTGRELETSIDGEYYNGYWELNTINL